MAKSSAQLPVLAFDHNMLAFLHVNTCILPCFCGIYCNLYPVRFPHALLTTVKIKCDTCMLETEPASKLEGSRLS